MLSITPPLSSVWFAKRLRALGPFESKPHVAVGVSGGPDSFALLALICDWAFDCGGHVLALCFDHGLRDDSDAEARLVVETATSLGADACVLTWEGPKPVSHIQDSARNARLNALMGKCKSLGILHLFLAHHGDDQAETVRMRLARHSGPDGLAAMPWVSIRPDVRLIRPLLDRSKTDLLAVARTRNLPYVLDPSNLNPRFERGRLRVASESVDQDVLCETAHTAEHIRQDTGRRVSAALAATIRYFDEGLVALDWDALGTVAPQDMALGLSHLARSLSGSRYLSKAVEVSGLLEDVSRSTGGPRTWGGCLWERRFRPGFDRQVLTVQRECRAAMVRDVVPLPVGIPVHWDGRYEITARIDGLGVRALGKHGPSPLGATGTHEGRTAPIIPWSRRPALPAIVALDTPKRLLALPFSPLRYINHQGWRAFVGCPDAPPSPWEAVEVRYAPAFPILERGLRLETDAKGSYIPTRPCLSAPVFSGLRPFSGAAAHVERVFT